jgi:PAS domain S-box-containing protein
MAIYVIGLLITALLSLILSYTTLRYRRQSGGIALGLTLLAVGQWAFSYVFEALGRQIATKIFWSQIAYLGTLTSPLGFFYFAAMTTGQPRRIRQAKLLQSLLWIIPIVTLVLTLTNHLHHLIWRDFTLIDPEQRILRYERGPWFWVMIGYNYTLLSAATFLFGRSVLRYQHIYKMQALVILACLLPPWLINVVYLFRRELLGSRDWTPVGFALSLGLLALSLKKLQLLDLIPIARDRVVESIQDGVVVLDAKGRIVDANPAALNLVDTVKRPRSTIIGKDAKQTFAQMIGLMEGPSPVVQDSTAFWETAPRQGSFALPQDKTFAWRLTPLQGNVPHPTGYLIILQDITERVKAETALQSLNMTLESQVVEQTAQVRAEQARSEAVLQSVSDAIMVTDNQLYLRYVNPAFIELTGYREEEILNRLVSDVVGDEIAQALKTAKSRGDHNHQEIETRCRQGRMHDVALTIAPIRTPQTDLDGYVCTLRDITQQKDLSRARKSLIDNISHQLRTPVTTLKVYTHLISRSELSEKNRRHLQVIEGQITWLQDLIQDILEVTSVTSSTISIIRKPVEMANLLRDLKAHYHDAVEEAGLTLNVLPVLTNVPFVLGDQGRLLQASGELLKNALHFTPNGGKVTLWADAQHREGRQWVTLTVQDTGPGIPESERDKIFTPFFRGRIAASGHIPGTGVGLTIAQGILQAHGGHITQESTDQGTTFILWLPAEP